MSHYYPPGQQIVIAWQQLAFFWHEWEDYLLRGWRSIKLLPHFTWNTFYLQEAFCTSVCKMYSHERMMWSINWWPYLPSKFNFGNFQLNVISTFTQDRNSNVCIQSSGCWCAFRISLLGEDNHSYPQKTIIMVKMKTHCRVELQTDIITDAIDTSQQPINKNLLGEWKA